MHKRCVLCKQEIDEDRSNRCADLGVCADCAWNIAQRYPERIKANTNTRKTQEVHTTHTTPHPWANELTQSESVVYYIELGSHIKISYSAHLRQRLQGLRATVDQVLAVEPGGRDIELLRHQQFDHLRISRRWENFNHGPDLDNHVAALREHNGIPPWLHVKRRGKNSPVYIRRITQ